MLRGTYIKLQTAVSARVMKCGNVFNLNMQLLTSILQISRYILLSSNTDTGWLQVQFLAGSLQRPSSF